MPAQRLPRMAINNCARVVLPTLSAQIGHPPLI
jgi:hypothetical protein